MGAVSYGLFCYRLHRKRKNQMNRQTGCGMGAELRAPAFFRRRRLKLAQRAPLPFIISNLSLLIYNCLAPHSFGRKNRAGQKI